MLYWLYEHMNINILQYISVRAGLSFFIAFFLTLFIMPKFIKWAKSKNNKQPIYDLAPQNHKSKAGTPTMGGVVFVLATLIASLLTVELNNAYVIGGLVTIILFGLIGVKDDILKIVKSDNEAGFSPRAKFIFQILASLIVIFVLLYFASHSTQLYVPFLKNPVFDMSYYAILFWLVVIVGTSNAVNLTDGLDGLATVPSVMSFFTLGAIIYISGNVLLSDYLLLPYIEFSGELAVVSSAFAGSLIAFLWFNSHPAEVFMGDSGSLAIGGFIGYLAIVSKSEILLLAIGFIFVLETVSVIIQVTSYKMRKKRVFLMAPIHHHFEVKGWKENKIIVRFWIIALMTNLIALISLKIR